MTGPHFEGVTQIWVKIVGCRAVLCVLEFPGAWGKRQVKNPDQLGDAGYPGEERQEGEGEQGCRETERCFSRNVC